MDSRALVALMIVLVIIVAGYFYWRRPRARFHGGRSTGGPREVLRRLWADHVHRTHHFIISALNRLPDTAAVAAHLHANQDQIAVAVGERHGPAAVKELARLLHEHIDIAARLVEAHRDGEPTDALEREWFRNADDIAQFLSSLGAPDQGTGLGAEFRDETKGAAPRAGPRLPLAEMTAMMRGHLTATAVLLRHRLKGEWTAAVVQHDRVVDQALHMADVLATGV